MFRWGKEPTKKFNDAVSRALRNAIDSLSIKENSVDDFGQRIAKMFDRIELIELLEKLEEAHNSKKLYQLTDYHFLILHSAFSLCCEVEIEYLESFFWDLDFDIDSDMFNSIRNKNKCNFNDETFGVVNSMKPHPDELKLEVVG